MEWNLKMWNETYTKNGNQRKTCLYKVFAKDYLQTLKQKMFISHWLTRLLANFVVSVLFAKPACANK